MLLLLLCYEAKHRTFCNLNKSSESKEEEFIKAHHCCLAGWPASLFSNSPLSPQNSQTSLACKLFLQHPFTKCPYLYSVLGSTGLQRCALCWAREPQPTSPPLPPPLLLSSSCLLAAPRRSTRDFTNSPSCSQLDLVCHIWLVLAASVLPLKGFSPNWKIWWQDPELQMINIATGNSPWAMASFSFQLLSVSFRFFTEMWIRWIWSYQDSELKLFWMEIS